MNGRELVFIAALAAGCANILDIEDPKPRLAEPDSGSSAQGGSSAGEAGASGSGASAGIGMGGKGGTSAGEGGAGGEAGDSGCPVGTIRCGGAATKHPEVCNEDGAWIANQAENDGAQCPVFCVEGTCTECTDGEMKCNGNVRQECVQGFWDDQETCPAYCLAGTCENPPSCSGLNDCAGAKSCCRSIEVPGGEFKRDYDGNIFTDDTFPATIDTFLLDKFEVTVGRMRNFVAAYSAILLEEGDGKAPHIADDEGWHVSYPMPATTDDLRALLACPDTSWLDSGGNENRPVSCVPFHVAYAFCIWDKGRLPTEAEWNYAAAGGSEQREFPWVVPATENPPMDNHAYFGQLGGLPIDVGSKPDGDGRWGHSDLTGNVLEWTLDFYAEPYPDTCDNCLNANAAGSRSIRGASYLIPAEALMVSLRWETTDDTRTSDIGFRCVHDLE